MGSLGRALPVHCAMHTCMSVCESHHRFFGHLMRLRATMRRSGRPCPDMSARCGSIESNALLCSRPRAYTRMRTGTTRDNIDDCRHQDTEWLIETTSDKIVTRRVFPADRCDIKHLVRSSFTVWSHLPMLMSQNVDSVVAPRARMSRSTPSDPLQRVHSHRTSAPQMGSVTIPDWIVTLVPSRVTLLF